MLVFRKLLSQSLFSVALLHAVASWSTAQVAISVEEEQGESKFMVGTSLKLGFSGFETNYHFGFYDENGYQYDLFSMFNPHTNTNELGLTKEQADEISAIQAQTQAELASMIGDAVMAGGKEKLEARFKEAEEEILGNLNENQVVLLNQLKHRRGIKQVGLAKYLSSSQFESPVSEDQYEALEEVTKKYATRTKKGAIELLKTANKTLLQNLTEEQQVKLNHVFTKELKEEFSTTPMFNRSFTAKKSLAKKKTDLYRILKLKSVRTRIGLEEDQYSEIKQLERAERETVSQKLTTDQTTKLNQKVAESDLKRMGSVNALCGGYLRKLISIDDEQASELHQTGKEIHAGLENKIKEMQKDAFRDSIASLPEQTQKMLIDTLGDSGLGTIAETTEDN